VLPLKATGTVSENGDLLPELTLKNLKIAFERRPEPFYAVLKHCIHCVSGTVIVNSITLHQSQSSHVAKKHLASLGSSVDIQWMIGASDVSFKVFILLI
jgi:hypothetical protein